MKKNKKLNAIQKQVLNMVGENKFKRIIEIKESDITEQDVKECFYGDIP